MYKQMFLLIICLLLGFVSCQYDQGKGGFQHSNQPPANILLHKQALGQDGSFNYAFAADNGLQQGEVINPDGSRKGSYSYVDPNGKTITLAYTAGKDGFRVLNGDHLPKAPQPQQQRPNPQYYQQQPQQQYQVPQQQQPQQYYQIPQQQQPQQYYQIPQQHQPNYSLFRPEPVPYEAYRNSPNAPAYRGHLAPQEEAYNHHHHSAPLSQFRGVPPQEASYRQPHQMPPVIPLPQHRPRQYSVQENPSPYLAQQYKGDYRQEEPTKPHSFGNGYSFEFAG